MQYKRKTDGTVFNSLDEAVNAFRCPGPCEPDCALYQARPLPGKPGLYGHMCNPDWYNNGNEAELCKLIGLTPVVTYVAVIKSGAVRDVQVCRDADHAPDNDDAWYDMNGAEIYLGMFSGPDALQKAAEYACTVPENISLIPVKEL